VTGTNNDRLLLDAYIDGELDPAHALEFERRLADKPALAAELSRIEALRTALREQLPRATASPSLRRRVAALVKPRRPAFNWRAGWAAMAASAALAFAGGSFATWLALGPSSSTIFDVMSSRERLTEVVVASHMRALMANETVDVASSDRHIVKPWFNGKLPWSPRVVSLAAQGFPLVGGRIDVIGLTPVATLVYRARLHLISVTALPLADRHAASPGAVNGYNIVEWTDGRVAYWAVSDLAAPELEAFAKTFRAGDAEP
jgi:anti-sigma factor RsiW